MTRTVSDTLADVEAMEASIARMRQVIYAKPFFRGLYDEALARAEADIGPSLTVMKRLMLDVEPKDLIVAVRGLIQGSDQSRDVPQTTPPEGFW